MTHVGGTVTLTLKVDPFGPDTAATVAATKPDGTAAPSISTTPNGDKSEWTAPLPTTMVGVYDVLWTVTGTGAGIEPQTVAVAPLPPLGGRSHASTTELANWLEGSPPTDGERLLKRATELVDEALLTATYATNASFTPIDTDVTDALRDATCAQVEYWMAGDEEDDILGPLQGVALGGMQLQYGAGANRSTPTYLAPRAWRLLRACPGIVW